MASLIALYGFEPDQQRASSQVVKPFVNLSRSVEARRVRLEHRPERWLPAFGKDDAKTKG